MESIKEPENVQSNLLDKILNKIKEEKIKTKDNDLFNNLQKESSEIFTYMENKLKKFPEIFEKNFLTFEEAINYIESIAIPSNCECTAIVDKIPPFRCLDCSDYKTSIYCSKCFFKSKDYHKDHKCEFLPFVNGMCDCGNPNAFEYFCPDHKGPFTEQKQIDEFIEKSFPANILKNLKLFLDDLFLHLSKYLIFTEKCNFFCFEVLENNYDNKEEIEDIKLLKENFCIIFQNFLNFLFIIINKNIGMVYLISEYFLKNHFSIEKLEERYKTCHSCIKLENKKIHILYENKNNNEDIFSLINENSKEKHKCECSFFRLLLSNWRDDVSSKDETQNQQFLISFVHNLFFKEYFLLIYYFLYKENMLNENLDVQEARIQFYSEENALLIVNQTNLFLNAYKTFYEYKKKILNSPKSKDQKGNYIPHVLKRLLNKYNSLLYDIESFTKKRINEKVCSNSSLMKTFIDAACLLHNQLEFKSIVPHPQFQEKNFSIELLNCEICSIYLASMLNLIFKWDNYNNIKEVFDYLIKKILNQKSENIKQLEENEFSIHLTLYRFLGIFLNFFSFNYALNNKKKLIDSIEYIKNKLFKSKEEMQKVIDLIIKDYFKMFGFIIGIRNEYFNYYGELNYYNYFYFTNGKIMKADLTLLKYLFVLSDKKINLDLILKSSNIEYSYTLFNFFFKHDYSNNENIYKKEEVKNENNGWFGIKKIFNKILGKNNNDNKEVKDEEKNKHVLQWIRILEILIIIMKNDSTPFFDILTYFTRINSLKTKFKYYDSLKKNEIIMQDIKNILKENIIIVFVTNGNWINLSSLKKCIEEFFFEIFDEKEFNEIIDELADKKINKDNIIYTLKDSSFKYLDMNYYFSPFSKSKSEIYITNFKKDIFKLFDSYYFKPSTLTFDFYNKTFENVLLDIENIEFLIKIVEVLLSPISNQNNDDDNEKLLERIKNSFLPIILNYLTILGTINSKTFIKFKLDNKNLINKICDILNNALQNRKNNILKDNDLAENVINTINKLNKYKLINDDIKGDLDKLSDYDYNTEYKIEDEKNNENKNSININSNESKNIIRNKKTNEMKQKYKNLMKKKESNFLEKIKDNKDMNEIIQKEDNKETHEEEKDSIMCLFCRNPIKLKSYEEPYGKISLIIGDFFYSYSFISSVKSELNKITQNYNEEKNNILNIKLPDPKLLKPRIISCGHYFHQKCFEQGLINHIFCCPVCEKLADLLIPPMIHFYGKEQYLKSLKLDVILEKKEIQKMEINQGKDVFKNNCLNFLSVNIRKQLDPENKIVDYHSIIYLLFLNYKSFLNYLGNLFYHEASTFHKHQQIDNIQNFILSIRYLTNINYIEINQIVKYINNGIEILLNGPTENDNIIEDYNKLIYEEYFDRMIFLFIILLDYDEIQKLYVYIINWFIPYFTFWFYLRNLISENNFYSLYDEKEKEKINIDNFKKYIKDNNGQINNYFKLFLKKLLMIKLITKYEDKNNNNNLYNNINDLSIEELFTDLNIENLYQKLSKNENKEINFIDLLEKLPEKLSLDNSFINKDYIILDYNKIINILINNIIKNKEEKHLMNAGFFSQFIIYKFELIELENNIFDFIEKHLYEKCENCNKISSECFICLICGKKICHNREECNKISIHPYKCIGPNCIFIDFQTERLICLKGGRFVKAFYPLYTNDSGIGPNKYISKEYYLNKKKVKMAIKDFICIDFH